MVSWGLYRPMLTSQLDDDCYKYLSLFALFFHRSLKVIATLLLCILIGLDGFREYISSQQPSSLNSYIGGPGLTRFLESR